MMFDLHKKPCSDITFEDVAGFCENQIPENLRLEYKQQFNNKSPAKQIAKEVVAFANTEGGTLIWGVKESVDRLPEAIQTGTAIGKSPRQTILTACAQSIFPPINPEISEFITNANDSKNGFLVVRVPASDEVHHVLGAAQGIYVRIGDHSEPALATPDQYEFLLNRRQKAETFQQGLRDRINTTAPDRLKRGCGLSR